MIDLAQRNSVGGGRVRRRVDSRQTSPSRSLKTGHETVLVVGCRDMRVSPLLGREAGLVRLDYSQVMRLRDGERIGAARDISEGEPDESFVHGRVCVIIASERYVAVVFITALEARGFLTSSSGLRR